MEFNYLTPEEATMPLEAILLQLCLGLQSCETKSDVVELLEDAVELGRRDEQKRMIEEHRQRQGDCAAYSEGLICCVEKLTRNDVYY